LGKLRVTSLCFRVKSPARRRSSKPSLRRSLQHQRPPRKPCRGLSSTSGTPCRPCKPSWTSGGSRRTHPKDRASVIGRSAGRHRNTSCQMTPRSATSSRYPSSHRAQERAVASSLQRQHPTPIR
jgi:hypothetical protein